MGRLHRATQVAVFDTAFHMTIPKSAYMYAIPSEMYEKHHIRSYGFHGSSYMYITQAAAKYGTALGPSIARRSDEE